MTAKTGNLTNIAVGVTSTWGTAAAIGANDKIIVRNLTHNRNPEELTETGIGSGAEMAADSQQGAITPIVGVTKTGYFDDAANKALSVFFQGASVTGNSIIGYFHSLTHSESWNQKFLTLCGTYATGSVLEAASAAVTKLGMKFTAPPNYSELTFELLANDIVYDGATNSASTVDSAAVANTQKILARAVNTVTLNGSTVAVTDVDIALEKPQESAREMKGSAGNGRPTPSGDPPFSGTVTLTFKEVEDHRYFTQAAANTTFTLITQHKSDEYATVSAINNLTIEWRFPALKIIQHPQNDISSGGSNPLTVTFKTIYASSIPSGMNSRYPHCNLINGRSTTYLA